MTEKSVYATLKAINIDDLVETKGRDEARYLSWSNAVDLLLREYPAAEWVIHEWGEPLERRPYKITEEGGFVQATVTIGSISRTQYLAIMNGNNAIKPENISSADINKAIMRCLTKAIALHGLGLNLWTGEDLRDNNRREAQPDHGNRNQEQPNRSTTIPEPDNRLISDKQRKRMYAIAKQGGWEDANVKEMLARYEYTSSKDVTRADYEDICSVLEKGQTIYLDWRAVGGAKENATKAEGFPDIKDDLAPTFKGHQQELAGADITKDDIPF